MDSTHSLLPQTPCCFHLEVLCEGAVLPGRGACVPDDRWRRPRQPSLDGEWHLAALRQADGRFVFDAGAPLLRTESPHRVCKGWESQGTSRYNEIHDTWPATTIISSYSDSALDNPLTIHRYTYMSSDEFKMTVKG